MSTDKFQDVFPNPPSFVAGEQPKGLKYSRWASQTDQGLESVEKAIGNMWASFEIEGDPYPILFASVARAIGSIDYINPYIPADIDVPSHTQATSIAQGANELYMEVFPADVGSGAAVEYPTGTWLTASTEPAIVPAQWQTNRSQLLVSGDWTHEGRVIFTFDTITGGASTITYEGYTADGDLGMGFSVIPNISQMESGGTDACNVEELVDGGGETYYRVTLPTLQKDKQLPDEASASDPIVGAGTVQFELPAHAQLVAGTEVPPGILMLWDAGDPFNIQTAAPISDNAVYYALSATQFEIRNVELEGFTLGDNNTRYFLVTMDSSLSAAVGLMWKRFLNHDHGRGSFVSALSHGNLADLTFRALDLDGVPLSYVKSYGVASEIQNNDHPMYMYREGYQSTDLGTYYNAMVGNLCLASSDPTSFHNNLLDDSVRLLFYNDSSDSPYIYYDETLDRLVFRSFSIAGSPEGGFQFGHSDDAGQNHRMQVRFLGPVDIQNTLDVDLAATFNDDLTVFGTLAVDAGGDVDIDCNVDIDGTLDSHGAAHFYSTVEVDGLLTMDGGGQANADIDAANGVEFDGVDPSRHRHTTEAGHGVQIPVEGIDRVGAARDPLDPPSGNYTSVKINAQGYAVYAP